MFALKYKRSRGVRVTARVHRMLQLANAARDRRDWAAAVSGYRQALEAESSLQHIWIQLAHAAKEQGHADEAESAYRSAAALQPGDPEPHLHLGHLSSQAGDHASAGRHFLAAFRADPGQAAAATALHRAIGLARGRRRAELIEVIRATLGDDTPDVADDLLAGEAIADERHCLAFDVSDLVGYFANQRLPTGIQRVQIQAITNALRRTDCRVHICCLVDGRDDWIEVPPDLFGRVGTLSMTSGDAADPAWINQLHRLHLRLALSPAFAFPHGATLVNLGSSWQLQNYFLFVREAKRRYAIRYVPFIHDLIPIIAPEHFTRAARLEVIPWALGVFDHADCFLANSEATRRDLLHVAAKLGHELTYDDVAVIRLDADFRKPGSAALAHGTLARWRLNPAGFVLLVSTVESRKGHDTALDAWTQLIAQHGAEAVPKLVCVGRQGWLSGQVYERLADDKLLASRVAMLSGLSDGELALLYRTCLFTIYPSRYEGWGLPITEALCYGKAVIASDNSSLREAGGEFAFYVETGSASGLADAVQRMVFNPPLRAAAEARIATGFHARSWEDVAAQIEHELVRFATVRTGHAKQVSLPMAKLGAYHSVARSTALRLWPGAGTGELFRTGDGWRSRGFDASWTRLQGGELAIGLPPGHRALRLGLLLVGAKDRELDWHVSIGAGASRSGTLARASRQWVTLSYEPACASGPLRVRLWADPAEIDALQAEEDEASIGLAGFFVYEHDDVAAGMRLMEAIALGDLDAVDAYGEPESEATTAVWD